MRINTELHSAALLNDIDRVRNALHNGVDLNAQNEHGRTALHYAAHHGNMEMEKLLIESGACMNRPDDEGKFPSQDYEDSQKKDSEYAAYQRVWLEKDIDAKHSSSKKRL